MARSDLLAQMISGNVSKLGTKSGPEYRDIPLEVIHDNPKNFFPVTPIGVETLAESIQVSGLQQPPIVTEDGAGGYRLVAGHRRTAAVRLLHERHPEDKRWDTVRCQVSTYSSPEAEELALIATNTEVRDRSWTWVSQAYNRTTELLVALQEQQGMKLPGRMRDQVAQHLKISAAKLGRAQYIDKHLIPELKTKFPDLQEFPADALAHLTPQQQREVVRRYRRKNPPTANEVKAWKQDWDHNISPFDEMDKQRELARQQKEGGPKIRCPEGDNGWRFKKDCDKDDGCGQDCCRYCTQRFYCHSACAVVAHRNETCDFRERMLATRIHAVMERGGAAVEGSVELEYGTGRSVYGIEPVIEFAQANKISLDYLFGLEDGALESF